MTSERSLEVVDWSKLPPPRDDGAGRALAGRSIPSVELISTGG